jgi:DNA-binding transcriptional LysR family regulator
LSDTLEQVQIVLAERSEVSPGRDYAVYSGRTWRIGDLHTKRRLLLAGLGWGYMPTHMVVDDLEAGRLRRLHIDGLRQRNSVPVLLVRKRDRTLGPVSRWMLNWFLTPAHQGSRSETVAG